MDRLRRIVFRFEDGNMWNWSTTMAETSAIHVFRPVHPGENILNGCLGVVGEDEGAPEVAEAASELGVPRETLQRVLDVHAPVTPDLARRLEAVGGVTAEFWLAVPSFP